MMWYQKKGDQVLKELGVSDEGLTAAKASEVLKEKGENVLFGRQEKKCRPGVFEQFKDLLVVILIAAAIISMFSGNVESTIVIVAVIILNAILGTVQHEKAQKSLESLKSLSSPSAKVIRDGQKIEIDSRKSYLVIFFCLKPVIWWWRMGAFCTIIRCRLTKVR